MIQSVYNITEIARNILVLPWKDWLLLYRNGTLYILLCAISSCSRTLSFQADFEDNLTGTLR